MFAAGDRVFGFADGFSSGKLDNSSFQTYTIVPVVTASKLPDSIDFEHGVMLPMAVATASIALFKDLGLPRPGSVDVKQGYVIFHSELLHDLMSGITSVLLDTQDI